MLRKSFYVLFISLIIYNIFKIHGEIWNDAVPDGTNDLSDALKILYVQSVADGSGDTTEQSTELTRTSIPTQTTISIGINITTASSTTASNNTDYSITTTTSTSSYSTTLPPENCNNSTHTQLNNGTCALNSVVQKQTINILRNNSVDSNTTANALILYFIADGSLASEENQPGILTPREIDQIVAGLNKTEPLNKPNFFLIAEPITDADDTVIGALSLINETNQFIRRNTNELQLNNLNLSAAAFISDASIKDSSAINMFIINQPRAYKKLGSSNGQAVVSSVIVVNVVKKTKQPVINFYFQITDRNYSRNDGRYACAFLNTDTLKWNQSGCITTRPEDPSRPYQCACNHTTTFALLWLPDIPNVDYLTAQDIASLVFLSISIVCFIVVMIHSLIIRFFTPARAFEARDLLPLISSASTTILFIFYIALTMTVYTRITSSSSTARPCFTSASVLMFFVYFFLIFMFCVKTSIGYFNYLRFVHLFPEPSYRKLYILLLISFFISITWTSFAAGFNSNPSFDITQLHGRKICWFTKQVINYFLTIPVSIFLLLNLFIIILVGKRIFDHVRRATSPHRSHERMKRCIIVILSSCITQGIGWLFGPILRFVDRDGANVLGWFFVIFNGLEGLWTILLYVILRSQRLDELKRTSETRKTLTKSSSKNQDNSRSTNYDTRTEPLMFHDLYDEETINWETNSSKF